MKLILFEKSRVPYNPKKRKSETSFFSSLSLSLSLPARSLSHTERSSPLAIHYANRILTSCQFLHAWYDWWLVSKTCSWIELITSPYLIISLSLLSLSLSLSLNAWGYAWQSLVAVRLSLLSLTHSVSLSLSRQKGTHDDLSPLGAIVVAHTTLHHSRIGEPCGMCVCVCACVCVCVCISVHMIVYKSHGWARCVMRVPIYLHICRCVYMCVTYMHMYAYVYTYIRVHTHVWVRRCIYTYIHINMHMHTPKYNVYTHTHTHPHPPTHTHTHTNILYVYNLHHEVGCIDHG